MTLNKCKLHRTYHIPREKNCKALDNINPKQHTSYYADTVDRTDNGKLIKYMSKSLVRFIDSYDIWNLDFEFIITDKNRCPFSCFRSDDKEKKYQLNDYSFSKENVR